MKPLLILQSNFLLQFIIITINFIMLSPFVYSVGEEMYLNPWNKLNKNLKIIDFNLNGEYKLKEISKNHLINLTSTMQASSDKKTSPLRIDPASPWLDELTKFLDSLISSSVTGKRRLKVLTTCNKYTTACRFLTCPNIKSHCILCDVTMRDHPRGNSTSCERFQTNYLTK